MMKKDLYFAYGSNLCKRQMKVRCPWAKPLGVATLKDFRLEFLGASRNYGVANVDFEKGEVVEGGLWEITPYDLRALDRYEGYPSLYRREPIEVQLANGETATAIIYIMNKEKLLHAPPSDFYLGTILEGYDDFGLDPWPLIRTVKEQIAK